MGERREARGTLKHLDSGVSREEMQQTMAVAGGGGENVQFTTQGH